MSPQTYPPEHRYSLIHFCTWVLLQHEFISNPCWVLGAAGGEDYLSPAGATEQLEMGICARMWLSCSLGELLVLGSLFHAGAFGKVCNGSLGAGQLQARSCQTLANQRGWRHSCEPLKPARCFILCYKEMSPPHQDAEAGTLQERPFSRNRGRGFGFPFSGL